MNRIWGDVEADLYIKGLKTSALQYSNRNTLISIRYLDDTIFAVPLIIPSNKILRMNQFIKHNAQTQSGQ